MSMYICENCGSDYCNLPKILILDFEALNTSGEELGHEVHVELKHKPNSCDDPEKLGEYFDLFNKKVGEMAKDFCSIECAIDYLQTDHGKNLPEATLIINLDDNDAVFRCSKCERKFIDKNLSLTNGFLCPFCDSILIYGKK